VADHSRDPRIDAVAEAVRFYDFGYGNRKEQAASILASADEADRVAGVVRLTGDAQSIERYCEMLHDAYERAAEHWGWATNPESRKPWADVPERNKMTMRMALGNLLAALGAAGVGEQQGGQA
jgi:hypothetical protein